MSAKIKEFDDVRLTVALQGEDVFDSSRVLTLPVGMEGTVVELFGDRAYEVEFHLRETPDPDVITYVQIAVEANQCERVAQ